jgi:hypothetical protein
MNRNWEPVGRTLQGLNIRCHELGGAPDPAWLALSARELATAMRLAEAVERLPCDALMRALLHGGGIGQPTPRPSYFCALRCLCALDTLGSPNAQSSLSRSSAGFVSVMEQSNRAGEGGQLPSPDCVILTSHDRQPV